ncbi:MAG: cell cycle transcriptional regulator TrcR [Pseudomonadota bacterium]
MSTDLPLMPKATAVWLVDNTTLTFRQIADFVDMHELEISGIADGEVAVGIKGMDPVAGNQLTADEIKRCEADPIARLKLLKRQIAPEAKKKAPRYTPVSKRQDRPASIAWLVRYHPELEDRQIAKLIGTTKPTIQSIRDKSHWNYANLQPVDPVALGLCRQIDLDAAVREAAEKKAKAAESVPTAEERLSLLSTDEALAARDEPALPTAIQGLENFSLGDDPGLGGLGDRLGSGLGGEDPRGPAEDETSNVDADSFFNLPKEGGRD